MTVVGRAHYDNGGQLCPRLLTFTTAAVHPRLNTLREWIVSAVFSTLSLLIIFSSSCGEEEIARVLWISRVWWSSESHHLPSEMTVVVARQESGTYALAVGVCRSDHYGWWESFVMPESRKPSWWWQLQKKNGTEKNIYCLWMAHAWGIILQPRKRENANGLCTLCHSLTRVATSSNFVYCKYISCFWERVWHIPRVIDELL